GVKLCEDYFKIDNFSDPDNMELNHYVHQALRANYLMKRDVDYIVKDGEILIVDEFTGRLMYGRRFSNGLHQAIEAKEGVRVRSESKTLATITLQNYFRMYNKLAGMTGTAKTEEDEFRDIYNMDVVVIPTNKPVIREDREDSVYAHQKAKYKAIVNRVVEAHQTGQPVLVGTISIEISELISDMLKKRGVRHNVLNAKHHEQEAEIVAEAGRLGAVTIATNMAGRGTDIILGGNPEFEARKQMRKEGYTPEQISFATGFEKSDDQELLDAREHFHTLHEQIKAERAPEQQKVKELGGLCIVGTERHESRRIDNQLRGRSGRQGDPGNTQFFIALEDDLMRLFGGERMQGVLARVGMDEDEPLEAGMLSRSIEGAQKKVEGKNFGIRKYVLQYDNVMNKQREIIYDQRRMVLDGEDVSGYIKNMTYELIDGIIDPVLMESKYSEEWDMQRIIDGLSQITPAFRDRFKPDEDYLTGLSEEQLKEDIKQVFDTLYAEKEEEIGSEQMREVERMILLRVVDNRWMDHIDAMDQLKDGIGLRGIGQQDPAVAYAQEGFAMFDEMIADIREETVKFCYNVTVTTRTERRNVVSGNTSAAKEEYKDDTAAQQSRGGKGSMPAAAPKADKTGKQETVRRDMPKVGRNDPCPCGSGKKYKNCCGRNA
ncbi:MAG: SEC-C domain-containing protein, partial [Mogibacterium sp.]|nr:SEC-C domain-containing protein [Mogibacterium sp.]